LGFYYPALNESAETALDLSAGEKSMQTTMRVRCAKQAGGSLRYDRWVVQDESKRYSCQDNRLPRLKTAVDAVVV
jgi:hypothetical protein